MYSTCTDYSVQCIVYSVQCTVYSVQFTVYSDPLASVPTGDGDLSRCLPPVQRSPRLEDPARPHCQDTGTAQQVTHKWSLGEESWSLTVSDGQ